MREAQVLVVGGGVVGATTALLLRRAGASVSLIDRQDPSDQPVVAELGVDLRTVALAPGAVRLLSALGVWEAHCSEYACAYSDMHVWDAAGTGVIDFAAADLDLPALGSLIENRTLVEALWHALDAAGVDCQVGASVAAMTWNGQTAEVTLTDGQRQTADLVVAADGGRSQMRQLAGIHSHYEAMGQRALVTLALLDGDHRNTAWQRFLPTGPLACLPLLPLSQAAMRGARSRVSVVWSLEEDHASEIAELPDAQFADALSQALEYRCGRVTAVDRRVQFPLQQMHADRYAAPGLVLVGDAAHVLHPLAGQGVNLGLRDAAVLASEFARHQRGRVALGDPDLWYHYERLRRGENAVMLQAMRRLRELFGVQQPGVRWLRSRGMHWINATESLKRELMWPALGLEDADDRQNLSS